MTSGCYSMLTSALDFDDTTGILEPFVVSHVLPEQYHSVEKNAKYAAGRNSLNMKGVTESPKLSINTFDDVLT